jgi:hypothetical protein
MTLEQFIAKYRISKIKKDSCEDPIILGKFVLHGSVDKDRPEAHHHIFMVDGQLYGGYYNFPTKARWNVARKQLLAGGATPGPSGDCDGFVYFDPDNETIVRLVMKLARVKVKRVLTEEQRSKLAARLKK